MDKHIYPKITLLSFFLLAMFNLQGQDIHFSQYYNAPLHMSPGLTGVFDGDMRFLANFRSQWYDVPVTYRTGYAAFDTKLGRSQNGTGYFGLGGLFFFDHAGDSKMATLNLAISANYTKRITESLYLTGGVQLGGYQRSFKTADLRFDSQYDGEVFDPNLQSNEQFDNTSIFYGDFSGGLNVHYMSQKKRTRLNFGGALFHINQPKKEFYDSDSETARLRKKWSLYGMTVTEIGSRFDLVLNLMGNFQRPFTEYLGMGGLRFHVDQRPTRELAVQLGFGYRWNDGFSISDAVIPGAEVHYKSWIFGLTYDINISDFKVATNNLGGPELSVIYILRKPNPVDYCPSCPSYL